MPNTIDYCRIPLVFTSEVKDNSIVMTDVVIHHRLDKEKNSDIHKVTVENIVMKKTCNNDTNINRICRRLPKGITPVKFEVIVKSITF